MHRLSKPLFSMSVAKYLCVLKCNRMKSKSTVLAAIVFS